MTGTFTNLLFNKQLSLPWLLFFNIYAHIFAVGQYSSSRSLFWFYLLSKISYLNIIGHFWYEGIAIFYNNMVDWVFWYNLLCYNEYPCASVQYFDHGTNPRLSHMPTNSLLVKLPTFKLWFLNKFITSPLPSDIIAPVFNLKIFMFIVWIVYLTLHNGYLIHSQFKFNDLRF